MWTYLKKRHYMWTFIKASEWNSFRLIHIWQSLAKNRSDEQNMKSIIFDIHVHIKFSSANKKIRSQGKVGEGHIIASPTFALVQILHWSHGVLLVIWGGVPTNLNILTNGRTVFLPYSQTSVVSAAFERREKYLVGSLGSMLTLLLANR